MSVIFRTFLFFSQFGEKIKEMLQHKAPKGQKTHGPQAL